MLSWAHEDPQLPVSLEIDNLERMFRSTYRYDVERWNIPDNDAHFSVAEKVMSFSKREDDSREHLKIVYYAGYARLMETRSLALMRYVHVDLLPSRGR